MKLVMTLRARDEADVLDANLAFHLNAGVDFVVAIDHRSADGTTEILESYARDGHVHLIREPDEGIQNEWVTRMARLAATDFGADWVINADADEFWWPRGDGLKDVLGAVPSRYGIVRGLWRHFAPLLSDDDFFAERMIARVSPHSPLNDPNGPYRPDVKSAHRADPSVVVGRGNHDVSGTSLVPLRGWYPLEVLHFRLRSVEQCARKFATSWQAWSSSPSGDPTRLATLGHDAGENGRIEELYASFALDDDQLARGVEDGSLVVDTRLRDALRSLRTPDEGAGDELRTFALPPSGALELHRPDIVDDARYAVDVASLDEANAVRLQRRVDQLDQRLSSVERRLWPRVRNRLTGPRSQS
jgi:hypothetical protein